MLESVREHEQGTLPDSPEDIRIALRILCRRKYAFARGETRGLDLAGAYLCGLRIHQGEFQNTDLRGAQLQRTFLIDSNLAGALFVHGHFCEVTLVDCILIGTSFDHSKVDDLSISFMAVHNDISERVAVLKSYRTSSYRDIEWHMKSGTDEPLEPNVGRFLDELSWRNAEVKNVSISDSRLATTVTPRHPIDLSRLRGVTSEMWRHFTCWPSAEPPIFQNHIDASDIE
jgi:hypothetical protein